jgi:anti-anti-sigma factor
MALVESSSSSVVASGRCLVGLAGRDGDGAVVWLRGEHDVSTVEMLSQVMAGVIALDDADVVLDLSGVEFMGAATVGVIVRAHEFLRLRSRGLELRSPSVCVRRVMGLCGLGWLVDPGSGGCGGGSRALGAGRSTGRARAGRAGMAGSWRGSSVEGHRARVTRLARVAGHRGS